MTMKMSANETNPIGSVNDTLNMAINKVMGQDTQSYEDFIGGFQHINKDLFKKTSSVSSCLTTSKSNESNNHHSTAIGHLEELQNNLANERQPGNIRDEDDLEEEVLILEYGTRSSSVIDHSQSVKFDNFVDDDKISEDEPLGYIASFGDNGKKDENKIIFKENAKKDMGSISEQNYDYLSEYNNSKVGTSNDRDSVISDPEEPDFRSELMLQLVEKNPEYPEEPDFRSELMLHLVEKNPEYPEKSNSDEVNIEFLNTELGQMTLYPGEADPDINFASGEIITHRNLDFKAATLKDNESSNKVTQMCSDSTDEVQPFCLDNDFDYDNVILTPKFTVQQVEYLKSFFPKNNVKA